MKTNELYQEVAKRLQISQADATHCTRALVDALHEVLEENMGVSIPDIGTFDSHVREERKSYIPHYGSYMILPPKRVVDFRPASSLKSFAENIEVADE